MTTHAVEKAVGQVAQKQQESRIVHLQEGGVYTPQARALFRDLSTVGVAAGRVNSVIQMVAGTLGTSVPDHPSSRTVRRTIQEGGIAADMQIGYELGQISGINCSL